MNATSANRVAARPAAAPTTQESAGRGPGRRGNSPGQAQSGQTQSGQTQSGQTQSGRERRPGRGGPATRTLGLLLTVGLLVVTVGLSLAVGARATGLSAVVDALFDPQASTDATVIREQRLPRTLLGLTVGAALGLAGAVMQALTRNPLAEPGILGVNAGAAAAVVVAVSLLGLDSLAAYVWFALAGAAVVSVFVYLLGSVGRAIASPARLALAGAATAAVLTAFTQAVLMLDRAAFDQFRFWAVGSLAGRGLDVLWWVLPFIGAGLVVGLLLAGPLNTLALGDEAGRALGAHPGRIRALTALAITLLCGGATAAIGPISFVGLAVPHAVRILTGPDHRWLLPCSAVLAPALLLASDVLGRVIARPGEVEVGIVTAILGAPVFMALARRRRLAQL